SQRGMPAPGFNSCPISILQIQTLRQLRMNLDSRFGIMIYEWSDPACLGSGKKLTHDTTGGENDRKFRIYIFRGRRVSRNVEASFAIRKIKRTLSLRDRIPGSLFKQPRRPWMIVRWAGPEHTVLLFNFFVRNSE